MSYSVVWFKRDLRLNDHAALSQALCQGPVLCLYIVEPSLWRGADAATQHYHFLLESLRDLYLEFKRRGGLLRVVTGEAVDVLDKLYALQPFHTLYAHQETGNALSYARDRAVARWCRTHAIPWRQSQHFGVSRGLKDRDLWKDLWDQHVGQPCLPAPTSIACVALPWAEPALPTAAALGLDPSEPAQRQRGGRTLALDVLNSFLNDRSQQYRGGISSPLSAPTACSRLSAYLTFGCLSLREVVQATTQHLQALSPAQTWHKKGLTAFISRLYWHCHFIQKLESEPEIEFQNMHRGYDGLRENDWNPAHFEALKAGQTGWPMVDACVAMLRETGWLNFRMRAMLVSTAAYPLWLDWRPVGHWLARQFLDYEPGIHWSQLQMQSGTTGINIPRIYNPIKQAQDHDPNGMFVRRWLPAMRRVPDTWLLEPWKMPHSLQEQHNVYVSKDLSVPIVELEASTRAAKQKLYALRAQDHVRATKREVVQKHGSRKRPGSVKQKPVSAPASQQQTLDF
jgi:deoxyribodipyrimidine photo-lyase